jgi:hypothetical protein
VGLGLFQGGRQVNATADWLRFTIGQIRNEIDCRIEHGADSNGHLEAIRDMIDQKLYSQEAMNRLAQLDEELGLH